MGSPFCNFNTNITVHQSKSLKDRKIGRRFALLWRALFPKLQEIFPQRDGKDFFVVPALDARSQVLSIVVNLAPFGNEQLFDLIAPDLRVCGIRDDVLRQIICQASQLA